MSSSVSRVLGWACLVASCCSGCSPQRAFSDWVTKEPRAAVFAAPEAVQPLVLARAVNLGEVRAGEYLSSVAGDISGQPNSIPVPFSADTPPLEVLRADLERMLGPGSADAGALRLDVTLVRAYVHRTYHVRRSSRMQGTVILDVQLVDPANGRILASERVVGEHAERPAYITSESVEAAVNASYAKALARLAEIVSSASWAEGPP
jgi:hypothetical protein